MTTELNPPVHPHAQPTGNELLGDIRRVVDEASLVRLIERAVDEVVRNLPRRPAWNPSVSLPAMLGLLTYSYLACRFASEDIQRSLRLDPVAMRFVGDRIVDAETIRAFRRANRPWLEQCIALVLMNLVDDSVALSACNELAPSAHDVDHESPAMHLARRRVALAALWDTALVE